MNILGWINRINDLYGNEPVPRRFDTTQWLRPGFRGAGLVDHGPAGVRQGYGGPGSGIPGKAIDNPQHYKITKAELNKIKKMRYKNSFFDWSEKSDWYKNLQKRVGGLNRGTLNKLIKKVVTEEFPGSYSGKLGREQYRRDTVVRAFMGHLENVGEFDGDEKLAKILEQFHGTGDHKFENINKDWTAWKNGEFEARGVDRSKLNKYQLQEINNWKAQQTGIRTKRRADQLKYLHGLNDTRPGMKVKDIKAMFYKNFDYLDSSGSTFLHRVDQLTSLKRTGKVSSGIDSTKSYAWNKADKHRSKWLKEAYGSVFQGNYTRFISEADKLFDAGNFKEARRLYAAADKYFGPSGIFTKAGGQGEHPLSRIMGGTDHQLKINSLVSGDLNQFKRINFDEPILKLSNEYKKTKPGSPERKKIIQEIENRKKLMNFLTESPTEKGIVEPVKFRYGPNSIGPSVDVVPIDKVKNFNVEDYVKRGQSYLDVFQKQGATLGLIDKKTGTITQKAVNVNKMLQAAGIDISDCLSQGGRVGLVLGATPNKCISKVIDKEMKLAKKTGDMAKFSKFGKLASKAGWVVGWADIPIELAFALPHLLSGNVQDAKAATTFGLLGYGGKKLEQIDPEENPEAYKYFKHIKDIEDWMDAFNQEQNAQSEWDEISDEYMKKYKKEGDPSGVMGRIVDQYEDAKAKQEFIGTNYQGYLTEEGEQDFKAERRGKEAGKKYLRETEKKEWAEGIGMGPLFNIALGLPPKGIKFKEDKITSLEQQIKQKGEPFYGGFLKPGVRAAAEFLGAPGLHDDWYDAFYGRDPREAYSDLPLDWASQLSKLEAKETREGLEEIAETKRKAQEALQRLATGRKFDPQEMAGGGLTRTVAPDSGPMSQGLRSLYIDDMD